MERKKRKPNFRLSVDEIEVLKDIHRRTGTPDGQFIRKPKVWSHITDSFNAATGRSCTREEILRYIENRRKNANWFTFDGNHKHLAAVKRSIFTDEQWIEIQSIYASMGIAADRYQHDAPRRADFHRRVVTAIGVQIDSFTLVAALIQRRKDGDLPPLESEGPSTPRGTRDNPDIGFTDIGMVG